MLKNKIKTFLALFMILTVMTTISFATEAEIMPITETPTTDTTTEQPDATPEEGTTDASEESTNEQEIYSDDLYLFGNDIVMDQLVDGNVYIMANTVNITGQINGNLFVLAQDFTLNDAYVRNSIFLCASNATFNGACTDLYAACDNLDVSYDSYIARDSRISCSSLIFKGLNTRNMFVRASSIDFGSESQTATIYGNLNYSSNQELSLAEGVVSGEVAYTPMQVTDAKTTTDVLSIVNNIISTLVYSLVIYFILRWFTPKFQEGIAKFISVKIIWAFLVGMIALIFVPIIGLLLLLSSVASGVAVALFAVYALMISIAFTIFSLFITKAIGKKVAKLPEFGLFVIVTIVLAILRRLPYISLPISFIMGITGFGIIVMSLFKRTVSSKKVIESTVVETTTDSSKE